MRYEKKYEINSGYINAVSSFLIVNLIKEIYQKREVNSFYYDNKDLNLFTESKKGTKQRKKIRVRYYNQNHDELFLENKLKNDEINWKRYNSLNSKLNENILPVRYLDKTNNIKDLYLPSIINNQFKPKLLISYTRRYFNTLDKELRITLDYRISFRKVEKSSERILVGYPKKLEHSIIELKFKRKYIPKYEVIEKLTNEFSLIDTRSSKYCKGVELLNLKY